MTVPSAWFTLPNAISLGRLLLAPVALWVAFHGEGELYKWLFAVAIASDLADGLLARLLKTQTVLGSRLDAIADTATYLVLYFSVQYLWPDFIAAHLGWLVAVMGLYALNHAATLVRFHRLPAYHTLAGKTAAVFMGAGMLMWFVTGEGWLFSVALGISAISALEQVVITGLLHHWSTDVPTVVHAVRMRREQSAGPVAP